MISTHIRSILFFVFELPTKASITQNLMGIYLDKIFAVFLQVSIGMFCNKDVIHFHLLEESSNNDDITVPLDSSKLLVNTSKCFVKRKENLLLLQLETDHFL